MQLSKTKSSKFHTSSSNKLVVPFLLPDSKETSALFTNEKPIVFKQFGDCSSYTTDYSEDDYDTENFFYNFYFWKMNEFCMKVLFIMLLVSLSEQLKDCWIYIRIATLNSRWY